MRDLQAPRVGLVYTWRVLADAVGTAVLVWRFGEEQSGEDADIRLTFLVPWLHQSFNSPADKGWALGLLSVFEVLVGPLFYLLYFTCFKDAFALVLCNS